MATVGEAAGSGEPLGELLVLADATLAPGSGFQLHAHQNMEVATLVLEGAIVHREPGRELAVPSGSAQWMSAGTGIVHAETNPGEEPARLLQIWIRPRSTGGTPEHRISELPRLGATLSRVSPPSLRSCATLSMARLDAGEHAAFEVSAGRAAYLWFSGASVVNGAPVSDGDGAIAQPGRIAIRAHEPTTLVVIDLHSNSTQTEGESS